MSAESRTKTNNDKTSPPQTPSKPSSPTSGPSLSRPSSPIGGWSPFQRLESMTSVLLSPLTNQVKYSGDTMNRALHLVHQHQVKKNMSDEDADGALTIFRT